MAGVSLRERRRQLSKGWMAPSESESRPGAQQLTVTASLQPVLVPLPAPQSVAGGVDSDGSAPLATYTPMPSSVASGVDSDGSLATLSPSPPTSAAETRIARSNDRTDAPHSRDSLLGAPLISMAAASEADSLASLPSPPVFDALRVEVVDFAADAESIDGLARKRSSVEVKDVDSEELDENVEEEGDEERPDEFTTELSVINEVSVL